VPCAMTAVRLPALSSTSPKSGTEILLLDAHSKKRRPLIPVIHNAKARNVASKDFESSERCFYALSHRGGNPLDSEFHMQARLGFRRPRNRALRLRPLEELPAGPSPVPPPYRRFGKHRHRSHGSRHGSRQASRDGRLRSGSKKPPSRMAASPKLPIVSDEVAEVAYGPEADKQNQFIVGLAAQDMHRSVYSTKTVDSPEHYAFDHDVFEYDELVGEVARSVTAQIVDCVRDSSQSPRKDGAYVIPVAAKASPLEDLVACHEDYGTHDIGTQQFNDAMQDLGLEQDDMNILFGDEEEPGHDIMDHLEGAEKMLEDLPDLHAFSKDDTAKLTKIQAGARGMLSRKKTQQSLAAKQEEAAAAVSRENEEVAAAVASSRRMVGSICTKILARQSFAEEKAKT